jgi:Protein phosphatase 2C
MAAGRKSRSVPKAGPKKSFLESILGDLFGNHGVTETSEGARADDARPTFDIGPLTPFPTSSVDNSLVSFMIDDKRKMEEQAFAAASFATPLQPCPATFPAPIVSPNICREGYSGDTVGMSIQGDSHVRDNTPCQDSFSAWTSETSGCIVVCDGAGSTQYTKSRVGAQILSRRVAEGFRLAQDDLGSMTEGQVRDVVFRAVASAISEMSRFNKASGGKLTLNDFCCTLVGVFWTANGHATVHIGDGLAIVGLVPDGRNDLTTVNLSHPRNGEYANETFFFPSYKTELQISIGGPVQFVCVMSDGVQDLVYSHDTHSIHKGFIEPILSCLRDDGASFLSENLLRVLYNEQANVISGDDKTLVVFARRPFAFVGLADPVTEIPLTLGDF